MACIKLRASIHHVDWHGVVEASVHASRGLGEVGWLLLWIVSVVLRLLLHHVHHTRVLMLHLLGHTTVDKWLLRGIRVACATVLIEKDTIVLSVRLCLRWVLLEVLIA